MSGLVPSPTVNQAALDAVTAGIPKPANTAPMSEKTGAAVGSQTQRYALEDHQHPRLTSSTEHVVTTGSTVAITFTRTFVNKPSPVFTEIEGDTSAAAQPAIFKMQSWTTDGNGAYTGGIAKVWRSQTVPQNLITLLLGAVFNLFTASVVGTKFTCIAVARSDVSSN